ncbi:MAG: hypothetical protein V4472_13060 [Pseudomonadota bacterium]
MADAGYFVEVNNDDDARAFLIARELIAEHGDDVVAFLQTKIDALMASGDIEQLSAWHIIRNAVALTLGSPTTLH